MKDESDMLREIGEHEAWLRQAMPAVTPPSMEPLKLRVRVAMHENWLTRVAAHDASADDALQGGGAQSAPDLDAVKSAVRDEVARLTSRRMESAGRGWMRRRWVHWSAGLAAAIVFAVLVVRQHNPLGEVGPQLASERLDDFAADLNEVVPEAVETASQWDDLAADIVSLEETLADGNRTAWSEQELEELDGDVDSLLDQIGQGS